MYYKAFISAILIISSAIVFDGCIVKQDNETLPDNSSSNGTSGLNTITGNNYFTTSKGSISIKFYDSTSINYKPESGKCDYSSDGYVLSLKTASPGTVYVNIYIKSIPADSFTVLTLVPYNQQALDGTNAWATFTTLSDGKTWRAVEGDLNVVVTKGIVDAYFNNVEVENASAVTDTVISKASAHVYCN